MMQNEIKRLQKDSNETKNKNSLCPLLFVIAPFYRPGPSIPVTRQASFQLADWEEEEL